MQSHKQSRTVVQYALVGGSALLPPTTVGLAVVTTGRSTRLLRRRGMH